MMKMNDFDPKGHMHDSVKTDIHALPKLTDFIFPVETLI